MSFKVEQLTEAQENTTLASRTEQISARHLHHENQKYFEKSATELYGQLQRLKQINNRFDVYYERNANPIRELPETHPLRDE